MAVLTVDGQVGSGARDLGVEVARAIGADYFERLVLAEAAKRLGATVQALSQKEQQTGKLKERMGRLLQVLLERSAAAGGGADPYFGPGIETILTRPYEEVTRTPITHAQELDDQRFISATIGVIRDLAKGGNVVIIGRGGCVILKDMPKVLHVGVIASLEDRIRRLMQRDQMDRKEAEKAAIESEKAREAYFRKFFKVSSFDPMLYHMILNLSVMSVDSASGLVVQAVRDLEEGRMPPTKGPR